MDLLDGTGTWAGMLRLNLWSRGTPRAFNLNYDNHGAGSYTASCKDFTQVCASLKGQVCELIELSAGSVDNNEMEKISFDERNRPGCPRRQGLYELYNVMWIVWKNNIAYREAVGRVEKSV